MLAIIGAGGHARAAYECFYTAAIPVIGFFDDNPGKHGVEVIDGHSVMGDPGQILENPLIASVFVAIGYNRTRLAKYEFYAGKGYRFPAAVHPRAYISTFAHVGSGLFAMGAAIINPSAYVGDFCIINTSATVGHDCRLERGVQLSPGVNVGGGSTLEEGVFVGIGAKIGPGVRIGAWSVVGAGAVVLEDVPAGVFCCGSPAQIKDRKKGKKKQIRGSVIIVQQD